MRHDIRQLTEALKDKIKINSFIEIGSRDGHDTNYISYYWKLDPNKCYIIEAHPGCYNNIISTYPQYQTINVAASDSTGVVKFNAGVIGEEENVGISSLLDRTLSPFISEKVEVDAWRMDEMMLHLNIDEFDLAKIDVEGFALQVLKGFGDKLNNFKALQIELEVKQVWSEQSFYQDVVDYLNKFNFIILDEIDLDGIQKDVLFINKKYINGAL
jgi:FkbM family methyltransferase